MLADQNFEEKIIPLVKQFCLQYSITEVKLYAKNIVLMI